VPDSCGVLELFQNEAILGVKRYLKVPTERQ
jgi:hypothetical protein